jgi:hypothetical protein
MFEPIRGGTRGGQAEFKWSDVSADKDRENYLGHSINAPTGRWQKKKDVHWYNRDLKSSQEEHAEEIRKIKEAEAEALSVALGFGPSKKRIILEHTRHGHKCDTHNSLNTGGWARESRRGSNSNGERRAKATQKGAQGGKGCKESQKGSPRGATASCPQ